MKYVSLGECCEIISGSTPSRNNKKYWNGNINWFTPKDLSKIEGKFVFESPEKITEEGLNQSSAKLIPTNSLLFSSRAPIGHIAINKEIASTNQGFKNLVPNPELDVNYLYYLMKQATPELKELGQGAIFKELSKSILSKYKILLPPLPIQQKIAEVLDKADAIRQRNRQILEKYDQLAESLFLEMFGDPVRNEKGWEKIPLGEIADLITKGESPKWQGFTYLDMGIRFITSENVRLGYLDIDKDKFIHQNFHTKLKRSQLKEFDILVNLVGASIGRGAIVEKEVLPANINQAVAKIQPNRNLINPYFLLSQVISKSFQAELTGTKVENARANISLGNVRNIPVILPKLEIQNSFVEKLNCLKKALKNSESESENYELLFQSLLQKAFKGELFPE